MRLNRRVLQRITKKKMKSNRSVNLIRIILVTSTFFVAVVESRTILFRDDFSGLGLNSLDGTKPDVTQGEATWIADPAYFSDGSAIKGSRRAYLSLGNLVNEKRGQSDAIFTLTARVLLNPRHNNEMVWEGVGFWGDDQPAGGKNFANGRSHAFILRRGNSKIRSFLGPGPKKETDGRQSPHGVDGMTDLRVVLDLRNWNGSTSFGTVTHLAKLATESEYERIASSDLDSNNSTFHAVGMSGGAILADYSWFELSMGTGVESAPVSPGPIKKKSKPAGLITRLDGGEPTKIVLFGTSLTAGYLWGEQLESWLDTRYPGLVTMVNSGMSGKNSKFGRANLVAKVLEHKPDVVFIEFAINDAGVIEWETTATPKVTVAQARENLVYMITQIQEQNPEVVIILQTMNVPWDSPYGSGISKSIRPKIADYYQMYRDLSSERGLMLVDHHPNWLKLKKDHPLTFQLYVADGVHPTSDGLREVMLPLLESQLAGGAVK